MIKIFWTTNITRHLFGISFLGPEKRSNSLHFQTYNWLVITQMQNSRNILCMHQENVSKHTTKQYI